jgi:NodT family efflux transporter outer membrane factor (OMF) lipoprotein
LEARPDVAAAERRLAAANAQIGVAQSGYFPTLSLSGAAGYQSDRYLHLISAPNEIWSVGGSLLMPLIDFGKTRAQVSSARAAYEDVLATYRQTVLTAFQEVEDNLATLRILAEESVVEDAALAAARQSFDLTMNQYQVGTVSYLNVISAQATLFNAERTAIELRGRRYAATVSLFRAVGTWPSAEQKR